MAKPAARVGDHHTCPAYSGKTPHIGGPISSGSGNVIIGNQPAARVGDKLVCRGPADTLTSGSSTVYINGHPAARTGDSTAHGGVIVGGLGTVLIGDRPASTVGLADQIAPCSPNCGNPVNPLLGSKFLPSTHDFRLPAPEPFSFSRGYVSSNAQVGPLGQGWTMTGETLRLTRDVPLRFQGVLEPDVGWSEVLEPDTQFELLLHDAHGRRIRFHALQPGQVAYSETETFWLARGGTETNDSILTSSAFSALPTEVAEQASLYFVSTGTRVFALESYQDEWRLTAEFTASGYKTEFLRSPSGQLRQIRDSAGRMYHLQYRQYSVIQAGDDGQRLTAIFAETAPSQLLVRYVYSSSGDLIEVQDRAGQVTARFNWQQHILTGYTLPGRREMRYEWSEHTPKGKVLRQIEVNGLVREYAYNETCTDVTDNLGRTERYVFTGSGTHLRWTAHVHADGEEEYFSYSPNGQRIARIDRIGGVTSYQYDLKGHLLAITLATDARYAYVRDELGRPLQVRSPEGGAQHFTYDGKGNLIRAMDALNNTTQFEFHDPHLPDRPTRHIDPEGIAHTYTWTPLGQLASHTDCSGLITHYEYDDLGQLIRIISPKREVTEIAYTERGQKAKLILADGTTYDYHYTEQGHLAEIRDSKGRIQRLAYDARGQIIADTDAANHTRRYTYDLAGRLTQITNANGATYTFDYDVMDRVVREIGFDGRERRYTYNRRGDVIEQEDVQQGQILRMHYDAVGRLLARELPETASNPAQVESFRYDADGRLRFADNLYARVEWQYDNAGRMLNEQQWHKNAHWALNQQEDSPHIPDAPLEDLPEEALLWYWSNQYEYNRQGIPGILQQGALQMGSLTYGSGHLLGVRLGPLELSLRPNTRHQEAERSLHAHQQGDVIPLLERERHYNAIGLLIHQEDHFLGGHQRLVDGSFPVHIHQFKYDARHRLTQLTQLVPPEELGNPLLTEHRQTFQYDPVGRLIGSLFEEASNRREKSYPLDAEGNRIGSEGAHAIQHNRLTGYREAEYRYDKAGNLIEKLTQNTLQTFHYDALNRLSHLTQKQLGYATFTAYFTYDALSRRVCKQVIPERGPTRFVHYGWSGDQLIHEDLGEQRTTVFYEPGTFVPLFRVDETAKRDVRRQQSLDLNSDADSSSEAKYDRRYSAFVTDHLGTPNKLIDEHGQLLWTAMSDDWAAIRDEKAAPNVKQPIRFQGQWEDEETGLYYNRYRYYDSSQGRYITQDPIGLAGGLNSYAYVGNPTGWVDPLGLDETTPWRYRIDPNVHPIRNIPKMLMQYVHQSVISKEITIDKKLARETAENISTVAAVCSLVPPATPICGSISIGAGLTAAILDGVDGNYQHASSGAASILASEITGLISKRIFFISGPISNVLGVGAGFTTQYVNEKFVLPEREGECRNGE